MVSRFSNMLHGKKGKTGNAENHQKIFQIKKSVVNGNYYQKTAKMLPNCYLSTFLALIKRKGTFKLQWQVFFDNCDQHFESSILDKQNPLKRALNKVNGINTSKNQLIQFFRDFPVFEYALQQKAKTRKSRGSIENFLNKKSTHY